MPAARAYPSAAGSAGLGHAHDDVGVDRRLLGQRLAHALAGAVDLAAVQHAVGSSEVHELEQAELGVDPLRGERPQRPDAGGVDDDHLARLDLADEVRADDVEGG